LFHWFRLEISQNRLGRYLNSNRVHEWFHPHGWEPEVLQCLMAGEWNGPVWDVGASLGRHAYRIARRNPVVAFEPNLNVLQFLGYNLMQTPEVVLVPCALTPDGKPMKGTCHADFMAPPTGPQVATLSVGEALRKFGRPGLIKIDIEGGEYELLKCPELQGIPLLIEWHADIPKEQPGWDLKTIDKSHSLLTPKTA
ncbi:MAG: FkbM family methyltransferase, partial [Verrucomicrobia bacterium]|nr:FkbM family methyltransferase [Verrucomicrobiota bacterium]